MPSDEEIPDGTEATEDTPNGGTPPADESEVLKAQLEAASQRLKVLDDPDVVAVLQAKEAKKSIRMVIGEGKTNEPEGPVAPVLPSAEELDSMSNSQLLAVLLPQVGQSVKEGLQTLGVVEELQSLREERATERSAKAMTEVAKLVDKYPDLGAHKEDLKRLMAASPGLGLEEAYVVTKMRKHEPILAARGSRGTTESPTSVTLRPAATVAPARMGQRGFQLDLVEALDRIVVSKNLT